MTLQAHPELCALAPDLTILMCTSGRGAYEDALDTIEAHAKLARP